jgi:hypothetical protein
LFASEREFRTWRNTSKIDLTVIWRGTVVNVFKLVHAL